MMRDRISRLADAFLAVRDHGWRVANNYSRLILVPPESDEKSNWCALWDEDGLPHWLPKYSEGE
ncbi:hypothetical protein ABE073_05145 [Lederbergia citrisecunda]|uniref:hypothetical protein n=1 Tax=Lederbergia citrisecunda TaxID=2833583 RepID=UPI003D2CCCD8